MGIVRANKTLSGERIECGEKLGVKLSLLAEPSIASNPVDIVLVLDRSNSMAGTPLTALKKAAAEFIDIIDEATDGAPDGQIGGGSRIGIVSFANTATQDTGLITSVQELKSAVASLAAGGRTNHADAFAKALALFDGASANARVMVMFTDGRTTVGADPAPVAQSAKAQGVTIYCIGLLGNGGVDEDALGVWASPPPETHVSIAPDEEALEELFRDLASEITKPGATDIVILDRVLPCFRISALHAPIKGEVRLIDERTVEWKIAELGKTASESAELNFDVEHIGPCSGLTEVNEELSYEDAEGGTPEFPKPTVFVDCGGIVVTEPCPTAAEEEAHSCDDTLVIDAGDIDLGGQGRLVSVNFRLKNVCPYRRVSVAVALTEEIGGIEYERGMKLFAVPPHSENRYRDVIVRCVKFAVPEGLHPGGHTICEKRKFKARVIAHYTDSGFDCCEPGGR